MFLTFRGFFWEENSGRLCWWKCCSRNASKNTTRYKIYMTCVGFVIRTAWLNWLYSKSMIVGIRMERYADLSQKYWRFVLRCFKGIQRLYTLFTSNVAWNTEVVFCCPCQLVGPRIKKTPPRTVSLCLCFPGKPVVFLKKGGTYMMAWTSSTL